MITYFYSLCSIYSTGSQDGATMDESKIPMNTAVAMFFPKLRNHPNQQQGSSPKTYIA
jgi:hypothetical protein